MVRSPCYPHQNVVLIKPTFFIYLIEPLIYLIVDYQWIHLFIEQNSHLSHWMHGSFYFRFWSHIQGKCVQSILSDPLSFFEFLKRLWELRPLRLLRSLRPRWSLRPLRYARTLLQDFTSWPFTHILVHSRQYFCKKKSSLSSSFLYPSDTGACTDGRFSQWTANYCCKDGSSSSMLVLSNYSVFWPSIRWLLFLIFNKCNQCSVP